MTTVAEKYLQIAKLANDPANAEVVIDGILTFFGLDYFDLDLGVEYLYTTKVIDHKFRSVLHKAEDMDAIMAWFKEKAGVTDEEIAAAEAKEKEYVAGCLMLAKQYLGMGHCISGKTYLELAAAKGSEEAIAQLKDMEYAQDIARFFVKELVKNGTTTCAAYATVHPASVTALFSVATEYNMCILAGKVMMNRNAPDYLMDTTHQGELDCRSLIEDWDGKGRNHYVITPRFAITSTPDQLKSAGRLHAEYPSTYIQTHLSENLGEIESVLSLCPGHADYLEVYERAGLLTDRSIFGHCVHLTDREYKRLGETGGIIAHCPTSNLFLGSGLFDMREANRYGVRTTLATDVGAGTSFSMWRTMGEAYKVQQLNGYPMTALEAIYKCTLGSARALSLDDRIGSFLPGREADFIVVDYAATSVQKLRMEYLRSRDKWTIENKLFGLQTLGDDRNTVCTYIMGKQVYGSDSCDHQEASM